MAQALPSEFLAQFDERFDCWNRGELDVMLETYAEDAVFDVSAVFTDVEPVQGHPMIRGYWQTLRETWKGIRIEPIQAFDLGDDRIVMEQRMWAEGQRSGVEVDQRVAVLYAFRPDDRKITSAQVFPDLAMALAEAESG